MTLGIFPTRCSVEPLTALGTIWEGAKLSMCSPSDLTDSGPAAQMSAPESGSIAMLASPLQVVTFIVIVGPGLTDSVDVLESWMNGKSLCGCALSVCVCSVLVVLCCVAAMDFC